MKIYSADRFSLNIVEKLLQGFVLTSNLANQPVLLLKLEAALLLPIIKGCPLTLSFDNSNNKIVLTIEDVASNPLFLSESVPNTFLSTIQLYKKYQKLLKASKIIKVVLYNESNFQIRNLDLGLNVIKENTFQILNIDTVNINSPIYFDSTTTSLYNTPLIKNDVVFKFDDYTVEGKHGYNQEHSLFRTLSQFFTLNEELFVSPKYLNPRKEVYDELTDFIIAYEGAIVLIENKFTISHKQNRFNDNITKGIDQLNKAENLIANEETLMLADQKLKLTLSSYKFILKLCVFYDGGRDLQVAFKNIRENYEKADLPIFVTLTTLKNYLTASLHLNHFDHKFYSINNLLKLNNNATRPIVLEAINNSDHLYLVQWES